MDIKYKIRLVSIILLILITSCNKISDSADTSEGDFYIPEAVNAYAIEKETEIETVEPTEEHKPLDENYIIKPAREVVIGEHQFITRINFIYNHIDDFIDSSIVIEGMYGMYYSWDETFISPMVYRNGPSDYGDDKFSGFYIEENPEYDLHLNDWIKVRGTPYMYEHIDSDGDKAKYMFLKVKSLEVLPNRERKAEMVND